MMDILDACCGSRMFWLDKQNPRVIYGDCRNESATLCDGRELHVRPNVRHDFRSLPYGDGAFKLVVFDPPHLTRAGAFSWMRAKYGVLDKQSWPGDLRAGFSECFRVLAQDGVLVFKWNETHIPLSKVLPLAPHKPLLGHPSGRRGGTHWLIFMKPAL